MANIEEIKKVLKANTRPALASELPERAMCIPLTKEVVEFICVASDVLNEIVESAVNEENKEFH